LPPKFSLPTNILALDKYSRNDELYKPDCLLAFLEFSFSFSNVPIGNSDYSCLLKTELYKLPNKLHLDAQINYPARVHEDKRFKKPKHKGKIYNDD
jgi:hypothetical protein